MTENKKSKKLSRRDAIKLLGAVTGATVLANLPSKWSTPEIAQGVLPAHAQTSGLTIVMQRYPDPLAFSGQGGIACGGSVCDNQGAHHVIISSGVGGIPMRYTIALTTAPNTISFTSPVLLTGVVNTIGVGASVDIFYNNGGTGLGYTVTWSFENPSDGSGSCTVTYLVNDNSCNN